MRQFIITLAIAALSGCFSFSENMYEEFENETLRFEFDKAPADIPASLLRDVSPDRGICSIDPGSFGNCRIGTI